jgi:outer membrane receptor protein involved in Fe transport
MSAIRSSTFKHYSFLILLLISSLPAWPQATSSSISGQVQNSNGEAIANALILLKGTNIKTETAENGRFKLTAPEGTYTLVVSRLGYKAESKNISVHVNEQVQMPVVVLSSHGDMKEVNIAGRTKAEAIKAEAFNVNVLDTKLLYNSASDLNQVLTRTSGVRIREDGGVGSTFSFSLNGFTGRQVKFFLDGIPMDNFGSSLTLNNFPVNMAERVEVYKGVLPISLGADALGGAVNIVTRSNPNFLDVTYGYGSFNTHKASVNHAYTNAKSGFTVRTNAFYNYSDNNYKVNVQPIDLVSGQRLSAREVERFHDGYQSITAQVEAGVTNKRYADQLMFGVIASGNDKDIQTGVTMDQVFGGRTSQSTSVIPTLKYKKSNLFTKGLDLSMYSAYNMTRNKFIDTTKLKYNWLQETIPTTTAELRRSQLKNRDNEGLVTANLAYNLNEEQAVSLNYVLSDFSRKSSDVEDPNNTTFLFPQHLQKQVMGLAFQQKHGALNAIVFSKYYALNAKSFESVSDGTGVSTFRESATNANKFGYGVAAAYFILPELQVKSSYEHTYRMPEAAELLGDGLYTRRNSALKPERSDNINFGVLFSTRLNSENRFSVEANYLFRNSHDFIRLDQAQNQPIDRQYINIGDVQTNGLEGELKYTWANKLRFAVNMTYQNIIDKEKFLTSTNFQGTTITPNLGYGYKIPNMPYLFGNADLGYQFSKVGNAKNTLDISYSLNFVEEYYLTPSQLGLNNTDVIPRQFSHNVMANYVMGSGKYNISLECRNLTNNDLFDNYLLQKPGRSFFLKLRYFIAN